jgi:CoA:oxalate CoA-transferase
MRVLDLSQGIAGPFCTKLLGDYGAEVVKVEPPQGDWTRRRPPFFKGEPGPEHSLLFAYLNTSKRSVTLDLESAASRRALRGLALRSDVIVTSESLARLDELLGDREALRSENPRLVATAVPYFESNGPYADYKATELILYAMSGLMALASRDERGHLKAGGYQAQYMAGIQACAMTLFAAYQARLSGRGSFLETSVIEANAKVPAHMRDYVPGARRERPQQIQEGTAWQARDGFITVMLYYYQMQTLGELVGAPELAGAEVGTEVNLRESRHLWEPPLRAWLKTKTAEEAQRQGQERHLLFTKVATTRDVVESGHLQQRDFFAEVEHPLMGRAKYPIGPFRLTASPLPAPRPAPALGSSNELLLDGPAGGEGSQAGRRG